MLDVIQQMDVWYRPASHGPARFKYLSDRRALRSLVQASRSREEGKSPFSLTNTYHGGRGSVRLAEGLLQHLLSPQGRLHIGIPSGQAGKTTALCEPFHLFPIPQLVTASEPVDLR